MQLEKGDYFVVTQGFKYNNSEFASIFNIFDSGYDGFLSPIRPQKEKPCYDRSYSGLIFQAKEICDSVVASICVAWVPGNLFNKSENIGQAFMFNLHEVEVMTVTAEFVAICQGNRSAPANVSG